MAVPSTALYQHPRARSGYLGNNSDPDYNKCYGTSKRTSNNVQRWLERQAGWETRSKVSELQGLAKDLVAQGVQMPANILDDLNAAIDNRRLLNNVHKVRGSCDKQHMFALAAFEKVLAIFQHSQPLSRSSSFSSSSSSSPHNSPPLSPTRPTPMIVQKEVVTPLLKSGNSTFGHPFLNIKPTYMEEDPMWK
ncbi:uncharacterized protein A1O9_10671 [Exophiala aquamarina CBS 119918]|uniref:DUF6604 domain-containing protein n=1 Tax=Exophiala aquamarina CBS 119918 TaxID=1182545 RepID=A0A072P1R9_9EURO|nr:uncharacterized protein A1O9_10671 [Exophiala aquamarina CBS 119918]KEF53223.1 hypothetical protein A1O9_10671 [Exophiala aquamarina CBS 119918]